MVERLLAVMGDEGLNISRVAPAREALGTGFVLDVEYGQDQLDRIEAAADPLGFARKSGGRWAFVADVEWAKAKCREYEAEAEAHLDDPWEPRPVVGTKPGSRCLYDGENGTDVLTIQHYLAVEPTGVYDEATQEAVVMWRARAGLPLHPFVDGQMWAHLFPARIKWRRMGEGGREVRLFESALIAFGYAEGPARGIYGVRMQRGLRTARARAGIAGTVKMDRLCWGLLFDLQFLGKHEAEQPA